MDTETAAKTVKSFEKRAEMLTGTQKAARRQAYEGKPALVVYYEDIATLCDSTSTCKYLSPWNGLPFNPRYQAALLSAGSGVETDEEALFEFVGRIRNMERAYEATLGISRAMDVLPKQFMDRPVRQGKFKGEVLESEKFEDMKNQYYTLRGWDVSAGIPSKETLERQGLGDVAGDLVRLGKLPSESPSEQAQETK